MATKIEVQKGNSTGVDIHEVDGSPEEVSDAVNEAIKHGEKLVTLKVPGDKSLSVVAERVHAIWQE